MTRETHSSGGFFIALITLNTFITKYLINYNLGYALLSIIIFFYTSYVGSLFPDIDMKSSFISKRHPFISRLFGRRFRHRGFTHSLICVFIIFFAFQVFIKTSNNNIIVLSMCYGFLLGYISHLFLDLLTKEGIELFYPIKANISIFFIKTNSNGEKYFNRILKFLTALTLIYSFYIISKNVFDVNLLDLLKIKSLT